MKKQMEQTSKFFSLALVAVILGTSFTAKAQQAETNPELKIQFAGKFKNQPVFEVLFYKADTELYTISVQDAQGYLFYTENIKSNNYSKKFLLDIPESELGDIIITLTDKRGSQKQVYKINSKVSEVHHFAITKI